MKVTLPESSHFKLHEVGDGVWAAIATDGGAAISNAGLVDLGDLTLVFDCFLTPQAAVDLRHAAKVLTGRLPQMLIYSHYHNDHIWGGQAFAPPAQIIATRSTVELIHTEGKEELKWYHDNAAGRLAELRQQAESPDADPQYILMWTGYYQGLMEALPGLRLQMPGITFSRELELHGKHASARLLAFEGGHTGDDAVLHLPQAGVLFMSDLLFTGFHPYLADGDPSKLRPILQELSQLPATSFVPGHGAVGSLDDLRLLIEYIDDCNALAKELVAEGEGWEAKIEGVKVPEKYEAWLLSRFFAANLRFLCGRMAGTKEG